MAHTKAEAKRREIKAGIMAAEKRGGWTSREKVTRENSPCLIVIDGY